LPISPFTGSGNPRKSFLDEPTQSGGFSPFDRVRGMAHIPLLGSNFKGWRALKAYGRKLSPPQIMSQGSATIGLSDATKIPIDGITSFNQQFHGTASDPIASAARTA
jgi:hypothetical protein